MKFFAAVVAVYGIWCMGLGLFLLLLGRLMTGRWTVGQAAIIAAIVNVIPVAVAAYKTRKRYRQKVNLNNNNMGGDS